MKNTIVISILTIFIGTFFLSSCVPVGKYDDMVASRDALQLGYDSLYTLNTKLNTQVDSLNKLVNKLSADTIRLFANLEDAKKRLRDLEQTVTTLNTNYAQLKSNSSGEIQRLISNLEKLQHDVYSREERIREMERKLFLRDSSLKALQKTLNDALLGFKDAGLSVSIKEGKVYVSLSNQLLFSTGKTDIDKRGKSALKELSQVLNRQPDINILVEGHTDNVQVNNLGAIKDNWDLSVMRSTEVIRYITNEGKVDPKRIIASGRSEYAPLVTDNTAEARAKNRRTEIILVPKLAELFQILEQK